MQEARELPAQDVPDPDSATTTRASRLCSEGDSVVSEVSKERTVSGISAPSLSPRQPSGSESATTEAGDAAGAGHTSSHQHHHCDNDEDCKEQKSPLVQDGGDPQIPVNLQGAAYSGVMATTLTEAMRTHCFVSPLWSSRAAFVQIHAEVVVPGEEGVLLPTTANAAQRFRFFNLEQTTVAGVRMYVLS
jgi:hypothetical protein